MSQQHPWGSSRQQSNRLPPISTAAALAHAHEHQRNTPSPSGSRGASPAISSFPSLPGTSARHVSTSRKSSAASSSSSLFSPSHAGQQPPPSQLLSSRQARTITPQPPSQLASSAATFTSASHGGGGANSSGGGASKLARDSPALSASSTVGSPNSASNSSTRELAPVLITQIFILLGQFASLKDEKERIKHKENIRKLVDSHGMEVFSKYFRRLVQQNAPQIFQTGSRNPDSTYQILVTELQKLTTDPEQSAKIADSLDSNEGDLFRDFDLATFASHFQLDPIAKVALAVACRSANKADLRTKADAILTEVLNRDEFLQALAQPHLVHNMDICIETLVTIAEQLAIEPPSNWPEEKRSNVLYALQLRYQQLEVPLPAEIQAVLCLYEFLDGSHGLVDLLQRAGSRATASVDAAKEMLSSAETRDIGYKQVADALLFMAIFRSGQAYNATNFVAALRDHRTGQRIDWQEVVHAFDQDRLRITKPQFLAIFKALLPIAKESASFDIQKLWGGDWQSKICQLSFLVSFLSCSPEELDVTEIPGLRVSYTAKQFEKAPEDVKMAAEQALKHPYVSLDATTALFRMIFESQISYREAQLLGIPDQIINPHTGEFLVSAVAVPKPWGLLQEQALKQLFNPFFQKKLPQYNFVLYGLWQQDRKWLIDRFVDSYSADPMSLTLILEHAQEFDWLEALIRTNRDISLDLAAQAHARGLFDIEPWLQDTYRDTGPLFRTALFQFLYKRSTQETQNLRDEHQPVTLTLAVKTVHPLLWFLGEVQLPENELLPLERICIQAYPRLINYGEGVDDIIDQNGQNGNRLPEQADLQMQEHFKNMYSGDSDVRDIINVLRKYKESRNPAEQDLFACMIHGLFDEYNCFGEYPLEALATTAVLFGGIINFNLLSRIALQVALAMVLEAVQEYNPEDSMYKFGLQALIHFASRLHEWPNYCSQLLTVPGLQGTEIWSKAEEVTSQALLPMNGEGQNGLVNGSAMDELLQQPEPAVPKFSCINIDPPRHPDLYEEPDEDVQDKIRFDLNNISERNVQDKTKDLSKAVESKHHQWFAEYLVRERAKMEPKNQPLYLEMLNIFNEKILWEEVLRETYIAVSRILNFDGQVSTQERTFLKNLGSWLGSLTIARDKPIKFRNISFKDLLIEGYDTDRLLLVIPFTCKVLVQAAKSSVFRWPNPWLVDIVRVLMELYYTADLKLNQKFEIEVLCKGLDIDHKNIEPSDSIRSRPQFEEEYLASLPPEGIEPFSDLSLMSLNRARGPSERFSSAAITASLPDFTNRLSYPPDPPNNVVSPATVRKIFLTAVQQAIQEIIAPVVERSVTIAAISASQLVTKDFAYEGDEEKLRSAAHTVVKSLSGSLALVTCKEPLRMSIMNNIRLMARDLPDQALPEGHVLMFVNENLELVCSTVEHAAEMSSETEIDLQIEEQVRTRRIFRNTRPNEPFKDPSLSVWAQYIPEPYRQMPGGLNEDQLAIYEQFGQQSRGAPHTNNPSQDSGRQVPDVLQDQFGAVSNLPTPSVAPADPRQGAQQQRLQSLQGAQAAQSQSQMNGYMESSVPERPQRSPDDIYHDLMNAVREAPEETVTDLGPASPIEDLFRELNVAVRHSPEIETWAFGLAGQVTQNLFAEQVRRLEAEVLARLLAALCEMSVGTSRQVLIWLATIQDDDRVYNAVVMACLMDVKLMDMPRLNQIIARAIHQRRLPAVQMLSSLMDELLFNEHPNALRADFALAIDALAEWLTEDPDLEAGKELMARLQIADTEQVLTPPATGDDQLEYTFDEWVHLQLPDTPKKSIVSYIYQLHQNKILETREKTVQFIRTCIDASVAAYDSEFSPYGTQNPDKASVKIDALASLLVNLVVYHGEQNDTEALNKVAYLDSLLAAVILLMNHHQNSRPDAFNPKAFLRLFSSMLFGLNTATRETAIAPLKTQLFIAMARAFFILQPKTFEMFTFHWLTLISHRILLPVMLNDADDDTKNERWDLYAQLVEVLLNYTAMLLKPREESLIAQSFYRGVLRVFLVIHHDFPEFLADNHFRFCNSLPMRFTQLRNLIVSAFPTRMMEMPDPFTVDLQTDRADDTFEAPIIRTDIEGLLSEAGIKNIVDAMLKSSEVKADHVQKICNAVYYSEAKPAGFEAGPTMADPKLIHALVLYVGIKDLASQGSKASFNAASPAARIFETLAKEFRPEAKSYLVGGIVNQLRWPNEHTFYFSSALLHLFGMPMDDSEVQEIITRALLERLLVHRPHPWGLIVTLLEVLKNDKYHFWQLDFVKSAPEIERLMNALFTHQQTSPRVLV